MNMTKATAIASECATILSKGKIEPGFRGCVQRLGVFLAIAGVVCCTAQSQTLRLQRSVIAGGGLTASGGGAMVAGATVGQPNAAILSNASFLLPEGFWGWGPASPPSPGVRQSYEGQTISVTSLLSSGGGAAVPPQAVSLRALQLSPLVQALLPVVLNVKAAVTDASGHSETHQFTVDLITGRVTAINAGGQETLFHVDNITLESISNSLTLALTYFDDGIYDLALDVSSSIGLSLKTTLQIQVNNLPPVANIATNRAQFAYVGWPVTLKGSYSDPGIHDTHTFEWVVTTTDGSRVAESQRNPFVFTPARAGLYQALFRVTDDAGARDTASMYLIVSALRQPEILSAASANGAIKVKLAGQPNQECVVQAASNLGAQDWATIATIKADASGRIEFIGPIARDVPARFFRVLTVPPVN